MPQFYEDVSVGAAATDWQDSEKVEIGFVSDNIILHFHSGTGPVEISFDGKNVHGELNGAGEITTLEMPGLRTDSVWFRGTGNEEVQIFAWAK